MERTEFVSALETVACQGAIKGVVSSLVQPAGRRPNPELLKLSEWFRALAAEDKQAVNRVIEMTASQALYNVLLALDGLVAIESAEEKGVLELIYRKGEEVIRLNNPDEEALSSLVKELNKGS